MCLVPNRETPASLVAEAGAMSTCRLCTSFTRPMPEIGFICVMSRGGEENTARQFDAAVLCRSLICFCVDELYCQGVSSSWHRLLKHV